jgi:hypothetical protein
MDFHHADAADNVVLNKFLWQDRMGDTPMPVPNFNVFPASPPNKSAREARDPD